MIVGENVGNKTLRRELSTALRKAGCSKRLYKGSKYTAYKLMDAAYLRNMLHMLSFKPGDLAHDCDGFNHRVKGYIYYYVDRSHASFLLVNQLVFEDGRYSCGCPGGPETPKPRDEIEQFFNPAPEQIEKMKRDGWWTKQSQVTYDTLRSGKHICDENGILLPEFRSRKA